MDVLFISDYSLENNKGGAQQSNEKIIEFGKKIGHNIKLHTFESSVIDFFHKYDLLISSNLPLNLSLKPYIFDKIISHPCHVRLEHDMNSYLDAKSRKVLFESSKKNFFLSKYHLQQFQLEYGDYFKNTEIVYDPIDSDIFYNKNESRDESIVYAGFFHPLKGLQNLLNFIKTNSSKNFELYGFFVDGITKDIFNNIKNVNFNGVVENKNLPDIFNKHKYIYHHPEVKEPFCRMIAEALMCGMEPICNDRIGSLKEFKVNSIQDFSQKCKEAPKIFWDIIHTL